MCLVSAAAVFSRVKNSARIVLILALALVFLFPFFARRTKSSAASIRVLGIQFEFALPAEIRLALDTAIKQGPQTDIFVLSEYSFMGPPPPLITKWCRLHHKYVVAGGEDPQPNGNYYNVVYVVGPDGSIVFQQAKCVPVQLMRDGLAATGQQVWNSPWGKIGFCICYDASYTRVTDTLVREGAQALIVPTMDVTDWGRRQHELHGRVGPMRAAEYGVPMFRLCSSGISQLIAKSGAVTATAPYPGQGVLISGDLDLIDSPGRIPPDRYLGPAAAAFTGLLTAFLAFDNLTHTKQ
jgi:apolipoprotein N-acyltransferase